MATLYYGGDPIASGGGSSYEKIKVDHLYILSASILDRAFNVDGAVNEFDAFCDQLGITAPEVYTSWANAGDDSQDYINKLPDLLGDAQGKSNVVVLVHGFGNDISPNGPYPGGAAVFESRMRQIVNDIQAAGHRALVSTLSYRIPPNSNPSAPYNAHIINPIIREMTPEFWRNGKAVYDLYNISYQYRDMYDSDGIHPTDRSQQLVRAYTAEVMRLLMRGEATHLNFPDYFNRTIVFNMGEQRPDGMSNAIENPETGTAAGGTNGISSCVWTKDTRGKAYPEIKLQSLHSNYNHDGPTDAGTDNLDLTNNQLLLESAFVNTETQGHLQISGLHNGLTGLLSLTAARVTDSTRIGEYTYGDTTLTMDGGHQSGDTPPVITWPFTVEDGRIVVDWQVQDGSDYAYINGVMLQFGGADTAAPIPVQTYDTVLSDAIADDAEGAAFNLMDSRKWFSDADGQNRVQGIGDPVQRIESEQTGVYMALEEGDPATVVLRNSVPCLYFNAGTYKISGVANNGEWVQPSCGVGTWEIANEFAGVFSYIDGVGFDNHLWGLYMYSEKAVVWNHGSDGLKTGINMEDFNSVLYNRTAGNYIINGEQVGNATYNDESYTGNSDAGMRISGFGDGGRDQVTGIVTYVIASSADLDNGVITNLVTEQRNALNQ